MPRGLLALALLAAPTAWAGGGGGALPWEGPLTLVATSLTGPVAFSISLICLVATGGTLVFGGELTDFSRRLCLLVLAIAFLVAGAGIMTTLFGVGGALVTGGGTAATSLYGEPLAQRLAWLWQQLSALWPGPGPGPGSVAL